MRLIHGIIGIIISAVLLLFAILWVPHFWGYKIFYVSSGSMEPTIHVGDAIYVESCNFDELLANDIVTYSFNQGRTMITHRIVKLDPEKRMLQTKGDTNDEPDGVWIGEEALVGRVAYHLPRVGYVAYILSTGPGKLLATGFVLWLLAVELIVEQWMIPGKRRVVCNEKS